ncbi:hypothetical protein [Chryseobacterium sp. YIM B08800]|uniref:hypothetical protein n=1 Tax=Chryseobacterium sp. YIM B08800 TaxID=2984136 RepID=UPI002240DD71|nr:hypothetical protein [Chryseobacterium sp. YIM B08800]
MKKILFVASIAITTTVNAKDFSEKKTSEEKKETKEDVKKTKAERCHTYGMVAWCKPNDMVLILYVGMTPFQAVMIKLEHVKEKMQIYIIFSCAKHVTFPVQVLVYINFKLPVNFL